MMAATTSAPTQTLDLPIVAPPVASTAPSAPVDSGTPRAADS